MKILAGLSFIILLVFLFVTFWGEIILYNESRFREEKYSDWSVVAGDSFDQVVLRWGGADSIETNYIVISPDSDEQIVSKLFYGDVVMYFNHNSEMLSISKHGYILWERSPKAQVQERSATE